MGTSFLLFEHKQKYSLCIGDVGSFLVKVVFRNRYLKVISLYTV
jgi:hypothetical protein